MPYPTPNLSTLQQQAVQDITSANITDQAGNTITGLLQKSVLRVLALVQAGFAYLFFRYLDYIAKQCTPYTATDVFLTGWMALKGVNRINAGASTGTCTFAGTNGTPLPIGTLINRADGAAFITTSDAVVSGGFVVPPVQAVAPGAAGTINPGDLAQIASPVPSINSSGTFTTLISAGNDQEKDDSLKTRGLQVYAAPPQGGAIGDYVEWAEDVPAVTRAWCLPNFNSITGSVTNGVVSVLFMEDVIEAANQGIPQGTDGCSTSETRNTGSENPYPLAIGDQLAVANSIFPKRPVTALVLACAPSENVIDYTFSQLIPNTETIQDGISEALYDMHRRVGTPGGTLRPDGNPGGELYESDWVGAIETVPGLLAFAVSSPTGTIASSVGAIPIVGTIDYG